MSICVIAPCLYPSTEWARWLLGSASAHGVGVTLYGVGEAFAAHGADAQVARLYERLADVVEELTLVTDCADVLFLAGLGEIERKFRAASTRLLMSAETGCWPPQDEVVHGMPDPGTPYRYVNAGQYIGETAYVRHCLKYLLDHYRFKHEGMDNSQPWWPLALLRGELDFKLDSRCQVFQTMSGGADAHVEVRDGRVSNTLTGSWPSTIHFNGDGSRAGVRAMYHKLYGGEE